MYESWFVVTPQQRTLSKKYNLKKINVRINLIYHKNLKNKETRQKVDVYGEYKHTFL